MFMQTLTFKQGRPLLLELWGSCMSNDGITLTSAQHDKLCLNVNGSCLFAYIKTILSM